MKRLVWPFLAICVILLSVFIQQSTSIQQFSNESSTDALIQPALEQYREASYFYHQLLPELSSDNSSIRDEAISVVKAEFQKVIDDCPNSELCDDAQFLIAQVVGRSKNASLTRVEYQKVIDNYPDSYFHNETLQWNAWTPYVDCADQIDTQTILSIPTAALAQLKIAELYNNANEFPDYVDYNQSVLEYQKIIDGYPNTRIAAYAQWAIGQVYNSINYRSEGVTAFKKFIDEYSEEGYFVMLAYERIGAMLSALSDYDELDAYAIELSSKYSAENYVAESSCNVYCEPSKWGLTTLTVSLNESVISPLQKDIVLSALQEWSDATSNLIEFQIIENGTRRESLNGSGVDIYIDFPQQIWFGGSGSTQIATTDNNLIWRVLIQLPAGGSDENLRKVALHEMGHALGLGHSFNRSDIMTNVGTTTSGYLGDGHLSQRDINTVTALYSS